MAKKEPLCDCGKPISKCTCSGHNHKGKTMKRLSKKINFEDIVEGFRGIKNSADDLTGDMWNDFRYHGGLLPKPSIPKNRAQQKEIGRKINNGIISASLFASAMGALENEHNKKRLQSMQSAGSKSTMKRLSMHKRDSVLTPPSFPIDPMDPKNDAAYYDYLDALDWEKADMESNRGRIYEQEAGRGPRRDITFRNAPGYHDIDGNEYMHVPKRLNSGRNFWGFTGSRAGLSPMTKRMSKNDKNKHKESKWEKDVARFAQIFDPRAFMNRDRLGVVEETNIFGIPYTGARAIGSKRSLLPFNTAPFTQFGNKNHIGSGPTRGSSAMKSMHKSISSMNQGGVKHVVGGYRGGKMSKAMDMKTHAPKMPSTKRDIPDSDKYFN